MNIKHYVKKAYSIAKIRYDVSVSSNLLKKLDFPAAEKPAGFFCLKPAQITASSRDFTASILDLTAHDFTVKTS